MEERKGGGQMEELMKQREIKAREMEKSQKDGGEEEQQEEELLIRFNRTHFSWSASWNESFDATPPEEV